MWFGFVTILSIFDSANGELEDERSQSSSSSSDEFRAKPDGWETTSKSEDGNVWEMTQREEDILLQEFERRIAYSKFQVFALTMIQIHRIFHKSSILFVAIMT